MQSEVANRIPPSPEMQARSRLKSRFELFSQPLPTEAELFAMWGDSDEVVASIACATFEHGALLDDAIRSFLMQKTDFRFEIIIRDDASGDGTRDLIAWYLKNYPSIIKAKIYKENQYKIGRMPGDDWTNLTTGKYIALCEGEDFWIDRHKLQMQVAQLEKHPSAVVSVAGTINYNVTGPLEETVGLLDHEEIFADLPPTYHHTSTILVRREAYRRVNQKRMRYKSYGDMALRRLLVEYGRCIVLPKVVSIRWINYKGVWSSLTTEQTRQEGVFLHWSYLRAVGLRRKPEYLLKFLHACKLYFPTAVKNKEVHLCCLCAAPFLIMKTVGTPAWMVKKLSGSKW